MVAMRPQRAAKQKAGNCAACEMLVIKRWYVYPVQLPSPLYFFENLVEVKVQKDLAPLEPNAWALDSKVSKSQEDSAAEARKDLAAES
ncbi:MAG: hypothetical protein LBD33_02800 [Puniceicoccales bacterium]|jgi:hypothetical protein|nr:hypothetical protein [Puniceicoccales bacterium]